MLMYKTNNFESKSSFWIFYSEASNGKLLRNEATVMNTGTLHSYSFLSWYLVLICIHIDLDSRMIFKDTRTHILLAFCNDNKSRREQYDLTSTNRKRIISYSFLPYRTQSRHRRTTEYQQGFWEGISQVPFLLQTMPLLACSSSQRWINFIWSYICRK